MMTVNLELPGESGERPRVSQGRVERVPVSQERVESVPTSQGRVESVPMSQGRVESVPVSQGRVDIYTLLCVPDTTAVTFLYPLK